MLISVLIPLGFIFMAIGIAMIMIGKSIKIKD